MAAAATPAPAAGLALRGDGAAGDAAAPFGMPAPAQHRLVIKNAELDLVVPDADAALDQVLGVVSDVQGYVLNSVTWQEGTYKLAKVTLRLPADRFEEAMRRLRRIGRVQKESSSGQDVTDEYVDLESQLRNLEATAERLRGFLDKATTVEESLKVSDTLKNVQAEIEMVKGRLNYLGSRAAFSTITVYLNPERPTATPTPTLTPTPTPTPDAWNPVGTARQASNVLVDVVRALVDLGIWVLIVVVPFFAPPAIIALLLLRRRKK